MPQRMARRWSSDALGIGLLFVAYLVTARSSEGFTPRLRDPSSADPRNLGALLRFTAVAANR